MNSMEQFEQALNAFGMARQKQGASGERPVALAYIADAEEARSALTELYQSAQADAAHGEAAEPPCPDCGGTGLAGSGERESGAGPRSSVLADGATVPLSSDSQPEAPTADGTEKAKAGAEELCRYCDQRVGNRWAWNPVTDSSRHLDKDDCIAALKAALSALASRAHTAATAAQKAEDHDAAKAYVLGRRGVTPIVYEDGTFGNLSALILRLEQVVERDTRRECAELQAALRSARRATP